MRQTQSSSCNGSPGPYAAETGVEPDGSRAELSLEDEFPLQRATRGVAAMSGSAREEAEQAHKECPSARRLAQVFFAALGVGLLIPIAAFSALLLPRSAVERIADSISGSQSTMFGTSVADALPEASRGEVLFGTGERLVAVAGPGDEVELKNGKRSFADRVAGRRNGGEGVFTGADAGQLGDSFNDGPTPISAGGKGAAGGGGGSVTGTVSAGGGAESVTGTVSAGGGGVSAGGTVSAGGAGVSARGGVSAGSDGVSAGGSVAAGGAGVSAGSSGPSAGGSVSVGGAGVSVGGIKTP